MFTSKTIVGCLAIATLSNVVHARQEAAQTFRLLHATKGMDGGLAGKRAGAGASVDGIVAHQKYLRVNGVNDIDADAGGKAALSTINKSQVIPNDTTTKVGGDTLLTPLQGPVTGKVTDAVGGVATSPGSRLLEASTDKLTDGVGGALPGPGYALDGASPDKVTDVVGTVVPGPGSALEGASPDKLADVVGKVVPGPGSALDGASTQKLSGVIGGVATSPGSRLLEASTEKITDVVGGLVPGPGSALDGASPDKLMSSAMWLPGLDLR